MCAHAHRSLSIIKIKIIIIWGPYTQLGERMGLASMRRSVRDRVLATSNRLWEQYNQFTIAYRYNLLGIHIYVSLKCIMYKVYIIEPRGIYCSYSASFVKWKLVFRVLYFQYYIFLIYNMHKKKSILICYMFIVE